MMVWKGEIVPLFSATRPCPGCGGVMIMVGEGRALMSNPPQYPYHWWCKCGRVDKDHDWDAVRAPTNDEILEDRWRAAQLKPGAEE